MKSIRSLTIVIIVGVCMASSLALPAERDLIIDPPGGGDGDRASTTSTASPTTTTAPSSGGFLSSILSVFGISHFNDLTINFNAGPANIKPGALPDDLVAGLTRK